MAMGIVDNSIFETELNKSQEMPALVIPGKIIEKSSGRGNNIEVPDVIRQIIGEDALENGSKASMEDGLAKYFNVSPSSLSAYKNGDSSTTTYDQGKNKELKNKISIKKNRIVKKAMNGIEGALEELLSGTRLEDAKTRDLASIARDLSGLVKEFDSNSSDSGEKNQNNQIIIYAPKIMSDERAIEKFDVIDLQER